MLKPTQGSCQAELRIHEVSSVLRPLDGTPSLRISSAADREPEQEAVLSFTLAAQLS